MKASLTSHTLIWDLAVIIVSDSDWLTLEAIIRNLVRRYVTQEQRKAENEGVTEDDVNEIKNDISAFRFEMIEIMRASGMNTLSATGPSGGN